jgi:hypothetical protein
VWWEQESVHPEGTVGTEDRTTDTPCQHWCAWMYEGVEYLDLYTTSQSPSIAFFIQIITEALFIIVKSKPTQMFILPMRGTFSRGQMSMLQWMNSQCHCPPILWNTLQQQERDKILIHATTRWVSFYNEGEKPTPKGYSSYYYICLTIYDLWQKWIK